MTGRLFVYGTLQPGRVRWPHLAPFAMGWTEGSARGRLYDTGQEFPAMVFDPDGHDVPGDVVELDEARRDEALEAMDRIEGFLYRRLVVETSIGPAWSYEWLGRTDELPAIRSWAGP